VSQQAQSRKLEAWLRANLDGTAGRLLGQGYQATVHRFETPFGSVVVKRPLPGRLRSWLGRRAILHEHRIYARLHGIEGIPRLRALIDDYCLVLDHVEGQSLRAKQAELEDSGTFFARLLATIDAMHGAGVAHGDLKRKDNILVGPGESPFIIDFGVACMRGDEDGFLRRKYFATVEQMDLNAWIKLKYRRRLEDLSAEDALRYRPLWLERIARWIRIPWQKITLRRPRQRWRRRR
jgi:serine/threonine protein kinase